MTRQPDYRYPSGRILVFARTPVAGSVKTRLATHIGAQAATRLHERLLRDTVTMALRSQLAPVELHVIPRTRHPLFASLADGQPLELRVQKGGDLGQRMHHALYNALQTASFAVLIGTDCPAMTADHLQQACRLLDAGNSVVLGPAEDGGYVLIAARRCDERLFSDMPWSSDRVLELTRERLQALRLPYAEIDTLWDVDRPEDLDRWCTMACKRNEGMPEFADLSRRDTL